MISAATDDQLRRALDYPYWIPPTHFVLDARSGETFLHPDLVVVGWQIAHKAPHSTFYDVDLIIDGRERRLESVCPVVSFGSNASPEQLRRKFLGRSADRIVSVRCQISGAVPVFSAHFAKYGAVPSCLGDCPGATSNLFVNLLPVPELEIMNESEGIGDRYALAALLPHGECSQPLQGMGLFYYKSLHGPLLSQDHEPICLAAFEVENCRFRQSTERPLLRWALTALFPELDFEAALLTILQSEEVRAQATQRLKTIRIDLDDEVFCRTDQ